MAVPFKCRLWFIYDVFFLWHRLEVMLEYSQTPWVKTVPFGVVSKVGHWNGSLPTIPRVDHHDSAQFSRRQFRRYFPNFWANPDWNCNVFKLPHVIVIPTRGKTFWASQIFILFPYSHIGIIGRSHIFHVFFQIHEPMGLGLLLFFKVTTCRPRLGPRG